MAAGGIMPYKVSRCIAFQIPNRQKAIDFYTEVLGLKLKNEQGDMPEIDTGHIRLFLDEGEPMPPIMELIVPNIEAARQELMENGCEVIRWEGKGKPCYIKDPFGFLFNVYEEPD
jgi:catechol 2,3-dioxygenase-like lactoylglutathione lyase family enzyme